MQAPGRGGFPHRRGFPPRHARQVHPAWAPVHAASVVGAPAAGVLPGYAAGAAAARPRRPALPGRVQDAVSRGTAQLVRPSQRVGRRVADGRRLAAGAAGLYRRLRQLGQRRQAGLPHRRPRAGAGRPSRRNAAGGCPLCRRRFHSSALEALRLGCDAFASDLNPVACLILKTLLEDIPRRGPELADELRAAGAKIKAQAEAELADLYPSDPDGATPIAYLWARMVRCESPNCGAEIPLLRSLWLCRKPRRKWALRPDIIRAAGATPKVEFGILTPESDREVAGGTVASARATCLSCGTALPPATGARPAGRPARRRCGV